MKTILVLGYFGYQTNQLDGQTIKTRNIYELLCKHNDFVDFFDTQSIRNHLFALFLKLLNCHTLVYLPGQNSLKYIFPFVFVLSRILKIRIIYPVVGGWLDVFLQGKKIYMWMLKKICVLLVESSDLQKNLIKKYGFSNVCLFPNFRINVPEIKSKTSPFEFRIIFMARVCEDKGIDVIFRFADYIVNNKKVKDKYPIKINLYGPLDNLIDKSGFYAHIEKYSFMNYYGVIEPSKVYDILSENDVLVLPTHYPGEGLPGSIVEAYIAGLPVIVSKWRVLPEFVKKGCGFVYDLDREIDFYNYILCLYNDHQLLLDMKQNAKAEGLLYMDKYAWDIINKYIKS